jgi:serine/threonine protein kinase/tetratricopeptide (TPR) repeat protein
MRDASGTRDPHRRTEPVADGFTLYTATALRGAAESEWHPAAPLSDGPPFAIGSLINGRYLVVRVLGYGGMGWVYDVQDALQPGRPVALKVVRGLAQEAERSTLFEAEFRTMTRLEHPNLARVYDFEQVHGSDDCLITMERIDGAPIDRVLAGQADWRPIVAAIVQVCRALSYVHSRGIVHHDLKPGNILVRDDGTVRVIDFGIARDATPAGPGFRGTPLYMAPEQLIGSDGADHRADIYSLGITLHELLAGEPPCPARRLQDVAVWALTNDVVLPERLQAPAWLAELVGTMCAPDPARRFRGANAVIEAINAGGGFTYELETSETRQSYALTPRFSGRHLELASVMDFVERRLAGDPIEPALLVSGESGIGKSRLMREVRQQAQLRRVVFVESNCYEGSPTEYGPIADLLQRLVPLIEQLDPGDAGRWALPELARIAPELRRGRRIPTPPTAATAEDERARLLEAVSAFLVHAAGIMPFVVYVNDLQWVGRGAAQVFAHLAERIRDDQRHGDPVRLALLGSYRSEETRGSPLGALLQRVRDEGTAIELTLSALEAGEVREIIQSMLGIGHVPEAFLMRVATETGGNPFFVQELMRMLLEDGTVYLEGGRWATAVGLGDLPLPSSIKEVFRRRFRLLTPLQQDALRALAVQARPMPLDLLAALLGAVHAMPDVARQLGERGLIIRVGGRDHACAIAHDRMRETIYADLEEDARRGWHRRIGELMEARSRARPDTDPPFDELAYHFWHAAAADQALEYALPAGTRARARNANQAALEHFEHALALLDPGDSRRVAALEHRADMLVRLFDYQAALAAYDELLGIAGGQPLAEARIHGKLADIHMQCSRLELAVEYGWKALHAYGEKRPRGRLRWAVATLGLFAGFVLERLGLRAPTRSGANLEHRVAAYDKLFRTYFFLEPKRTFLCTLRLWRIAGVSRDFEAMACAKSGVAMMIGIAGLRRWAYELFEEARRDADSAGSRWWSGTVEMRRGVVARMAGLWNLERLDAAVQSLRDAGDMFDLAAAVYHAAEACYYAGQVDAAFERTRALNAATARIEPGAPSSLRSTRVFEELCRALRGAPDERRFQELYAAALAMKDVVVTAAVLHDWGEVLVRHGRAEEGVEKLEQGYELWTRERLLDGYTSSILYRLPRAYLELARLDPGRARRLRRLQAAAMRKTRRIHRHWRSPVLVNQAMLLERAGRPAQADACFQEAVDVARGQNAGLFLSTGLYEWSLALLKRGDSDAAVARLEEALRMARDGGNVWLANRCGEALGDLRVGGDARGPATGSRAPA